MNRNTFLKGLLLGAGSLITTIPTDCLLETYYEDRKMQNSSVYKLIIQKLKDVNIRTHENYSIERESESLTIILPDEHTKRVHSEQIKLINRISEVITIDAIGVEGVFEKIDSDLYVKMKSAENIFSKILSKNNTDITHFNNALESIISDTNRKAIIMEKVRKASEYILLLSLNEDEQKYFTTPGFNLIWELYSRHALFGLETIENYKDSSNLIKDVHNTYAAMKAYPLLQESENLKRVLHTTKPELQDELNIMISYLDNICEIAYKRCNGCKNLDILDQNIKNNTKKAIENIKVRNNGWVENTQKNLSKKRVIIEIGGAEHIDDFYRQLIEKTKYNIITVDNGIKI